MWWAMGCTMRSIRNSIEMRRDCIMVMPFGWRAHSSLEHVRIRMLVCMVFVLIACGSAPVVAACRDQEMAHGVMPVAYAAVSDAVLQYFGHNFFQITTDKGTKIVTDPLAPGMYPTPSLAPHAVTIGREHPNHNYVQLAQGNPLILRGLVANGAEWNRVRTKVREVSISNIPIY